MDTNFAFFSWMKDFKHVSVFTSSSCRLAIPEVPPLEVVKGHHIARTEFFWQELKANCPWEVKGRQQSLASDIDNIYFFSVAPGKKVPILTKDRDFAIFLIPVETLLPVKCGGPYIMPSSSDPQTLRSSVDGGCYVVPGRAIQFFFYRTLLQVYSDT